MSRPWPQQPEPRRAGIEEAHLLGVLRGAHVTYTRRTYYVSNDGRAVETAS